MYDLIFHPESELHLLDEETVLFLAPRSKRKATYSLCSVNVGECHEDAPLISYFPPLFKKENKIND